jgi:release factor glutamine methyltransferase
MTPMTRRQALLAASKVLSVDPHLRDTAARDAELLLLNQLGIDRVQLFTNPDRELSEKEELSFWQNVHRRAASEPIQYITGQQEFYGLNLHVTPAVLIPRPETEHLVEAVLKFLSADKPQTIADIGTGSGAIAIALAAHLPHARITALDISTEALAVAQANARAHNVADRIQFLQSDLLSVLNRKTEIFDAIVSNPPYVAESDRDTLHPQVRDHEPSTALFAGETGLDIYRRLIPDAFISLKPGGLLALEIGQGQQNAIASLLETWRNLSFINDLQHIPRVALARRPDSSAIR